ncbi:hypothetical protein NM208_g7221 [Fusarium decemcellulare]|uniref:Uncharacterized protein n=1 Tax=Fusarium decemcellulare TaxID=57161 RepID=A0ACC1SA17_9HYPO|nr:hypothetical protein NM208_g7221 [Fusarium decemcellulare]
MLSTLGLAQFDDHTAPSAIDESIQLRRPLSWSGDGDASLHRLAQILFGLDPTQLQLWPGYRAFVCHIHDRFMGIKPGYIDPVILREEAPEMTMGIPQCIKLLSEVSQAVKDSTKDNPTIDDIVSQWIESQGKATPVPGTGESPAYRRAVFCALAWVTLLVDIPQRPPEDCFGVTFPSNSPSSQVTQRFDCARRPIDAMFRGLCQTRLPQRTNHAILEGREQPDLIHVSSVRYSMLYEFGKVTVEWTGIMSCHLEFDLPTRTLYLFNLPTYCALACFREGRDCIFDRCDTFEK